ncbi:MAG TPA: matrixin family metalloprotease [Lacipirellulaceae bacterium]|nr:matrixin family metalloprotease [Lacipirellulaceae bacterium]
MLRRFVFYLALVILGSLQPAPRLRAFIINSTDPDPWLTTASGTRSGNGDPATITWSIVPDGTRVSTGVGTRTTASNLISTLDSAFGGNPSQTDLTQQPWFSLIAGAFGRWSQLGSVDYVYESHDDGVLHPSSDGQLGVRGDIRLAGFNIDGSGGTLAFTYIPTAGSDMAVDTADMTFFKDNSKGLNYINFRDTLMHEIGHSFGLEHVSSTTDSLLMEPVIDTSSTQPNGPQLDEVRGVQFFFGDPNERSNGGLGNGTAARATSLGPIAEGSTRLVGASADVPKQAISGTATDFVSISNASDIDYYSFNVSQPSLLSATLTPRGGVFTQGSADDNQTPTTFDANSRSNLALSLFNTNGTSILATADANQAGGIESLANLLLPSAGTYYARISGADDTIQMYELALSPTPILPGDYNHDGIVDAADYIVWRRLLGQSVTTGSGADGNFDGHVTHADFSVWQTNFGEVASAGAGSGFIAGATVPEPLCLFLAVFGCVFLIAARRRRKCPSPALC